MKIMSAMVAVALGILNSLPALAEDIVVGPIRISGVWAMDLPPQSAMVLMTLTNTGDVTDNLIGISSDVAETCDLHAIFEAGGKPTMVALSAVELQPGKSVSLSADSLHVMLEGVRRPLAGGAVLPLTLEFAVAGKTTIAAPVETRQP